MSEEEQELEFVVEPPEGFILGDGDIAVFDKVEFAEATDSIAAMVRDRDLFALQRTTMKWVNVTELGKRAKLVEVKKDRL